MNDQQPTNAGQQPVGTGQQPYAVYGGLPITPQESQPSSSLSFKEGGLDAVSRDIDSPMSLFDSLQAKSGDLGVPFPSFGVIGLGVTRAHDKAIERQVAALNQGKKALESWKTALKAADANYRAAETPPGTGNGQTPPPSGDPGLGGLPTGEMPAVPDMDSTDAGLPSADSPEMDLGEGDLPGTDNSGAELPGTNTPGADTSGTDVLPGETPSGSLPGNQSSDLDPPNPGSSGVDDPNMKVPGLDSVLNPRQDKTDLSPFDPGTQLSGVPNPSLIDPSTRPGSTLGSPIGNGAVGVGSGNGAGLRPSGMSASGTMGNSMPMMPMMPMTGAGTGADERDREQSPLLSEDESVWDGDEDIAPEIIG
ncbi:hypothetical protein ACIBQ1_34225 [Nonomuraea sp. NPDC050153]|uniref:hypothetical protein n=1 Tax=Nonomuraea sp. NPDC050153 TaxID=3364359 RepID=UPI00379FF535